MLIQGLHSCPESALVGLDGFYAGIIRSYVYVNKIFYDQNKCFVNHLNSFNNKNDLISHVSNVHSAKTVHYKHCSYSSTSKAHMRLHVHLHSDGMKCSDCGRGYPNKHTLVRHKLLYQKRTEFCCTACSKKFATPNSLQIHVKGKHGYGYYCLCGKRFESLAQCSRHQKKCTGLGWLRGTL